jgi:hypothetical protein
MGATAMKTIFEEEIQERRALLLKSWPAFVREPPFLIAAVIDRDKTGIDFCPWAPGLAIASDCLLRAAGHRPGIRGPGGWTETNPDVFTKVLYRNRLWVRGCGCGELWTVERDNEEVLAFPFGPTPIYTRTRQAAMRLADYCHPKPRKGEGPFPEPRGVASTLRWQASDPFGVRFCN